jgi:hypothetical protein
MRPPLTSVPEKRPHKPDNGSNAKDLAPTDINEWNNSHRSESSHSPPTTSVLENS